MTARTLLPPVFHNLHVRFLAGGLLVNFGLAVVYHYINNGSPLIPLSELPGFYTQGWPIMLQTFIILYFTYYTVRYFDRQYPEAPNSSRRFGRELLFVLLAGFALMELFHWVFVTWMVVPEEDVVFLERKLKMIQAIDVTFLLLVYTFITANRIFRFYEQQHLALLGWKRALAQEQYEAARHQLNPELLFGSLDHLETLVHTDANRAETFIEELSRTYRGQLERDAPTGTDEPTGLLEGHPEQSKARSLSPLQLTLAVMALASLFYPLFFAYIDRNFRPSVLLLEFVFTLARLGGIAFICYGSILLVARAGRRLPVFLRRAAELVLLLCATYSFLLAFVLLVDRPLTGSPAPDPASWDFRRYIGLYILGAVFIYIFLLGLNIYQQAQASVAQAEKVRREFLQMRLQALRNQVNPHFLFNSLSVLSSLVQTDAGLALRFIRQLTTVYRYILDQQELELVTLRQELQFLDAYFFLLQIRFGRKISLQQQLEIDTEGWKLPPLTLQLLVENAVKHNRMSVAQPLRITLQASAGRLLLRNNRSPRDEAAPSTGVGLKNIRGRYALLTRTPVVVETGSDTFTVTIPLIKADS